MIPPPTRPTLRLNSRLGTITRQRLSHTVPCSQRVFLLSLLSWWRWLRHMFVIMFAVLRIVMLVITSTERVYLLLLQSDSMLLLIPLEREVP